ncbi:hypothetical protein LTR05_000824 [Lithohypha guttulata]|uniref:FAD-binding domain-containing protein n=1 Tax=Lithohypha guttulata TaxID=1690604 RepID=A0AAN7T6M9_9EURO|nr:hypothetical protein LTR05_000824 [Lithohypha guttulata]
MGSRQVEQKVLVIGAGIVGLLIAQGLKKEGIACTVYESEPSAKHYRPREWGMSIQWGLPLLKTCFDEDKYNKLSTTAVDPNFEPPEPGKVPTFNGETGEWIIDIPLVRTYRVSRRKFRAFCAEDINVQYDKKLKDIVYSDTDTTVTAQFEDGSSATGTLLVGAEGTHSLTRHLIFDNDESKAAAHSVLFNAINLHVCYNDAEKARHVRRHHPIMYHAIHPRGYWLFVAIQDVPDPDKPETWVFQLQCTWKKTLEPDLSEDEVSSLEKHKKRAETFGEPFKSANLWIPEGTKLSVNKLGYWVPEKWNTRNGRVIIAGDAAHPMTFQRGQGLNHGIADAASLTKLLAAVKDGSKSQEAAIEEYVDEMVPRAGEEVKMSIVNTEMLHDFEKMTNSPFFKKGGHANAGNKQALEEQRAKEEAA